MGCKMYECDTTVAMATVGWQKWQDVMDGRCGFENGTIFKELALPFLGAKAACDPSFHHPSCDVCGGSRQEGRTMSRRPMPETRYRNEYARGNMGRRCDCR